MLVYLAVSVLLGSVNGLITWPLYTDVGEAALAMNELTGNVHVYATCRYVLFTEHVTFMEAEDKCKEVKLGMTTTTGRGRLATINNEQKNLELSDLMKVAFGPSIGPELGGKYNSTNWLWVGLRKVRNLLSAGGTLSLAQKRKQAMKLKGSFSLADWEWEDGSGANEKWMNWDDTQPDQKPDDDGFEQNQVRMFKKGPWDDSYEYKESPYACDYRGKYIIVETPMYVSNASDACVAAGLTLAKIRSLEENDELVAAFEVFLPSSSDAAWADTNWVWIGANDLKEEGNFTFFDGEKIGFKIPWGKKQPDNSHKHFGKDISQNYIAVNRKGKWDDSYGQNRMRPFACMCPDA